jgi:hypothetical protein
MNAVLVMILCLAGDPGEAIRPPEWPARYRCCSAACLLSISVSEWLRMHPSCSEYRLQSSRCETGERT